MKKKYRATKGAPFSQAEAQTYGEELDKIAEANDGTIKPEDVIEEAESVRNPLHNYFEWDDDKAGERYRLWQARNLINHIIVIVKYDHKEKEQKAFFSVNSTPDEKLKNKIYVTVEKMISQPELRKQILKRALDEIEYWQERYAEYKELAKIFNAIKITKRLIRSKIRSRNKTR